MKCIICGATANVEYSDLQDRLHTDVQGSYTLLKCSSCALLYIDPLPTDKDLNAHYPDTYHVYQRLSPKISPRKLSYAWKVAKNYFGYGASSFLSRVLLVPFYFKIAQLPYWKKNGRLLDVGCSVGDRMQLFEELGWSVAGLEMSSKAAKVAVEAGYDVVNTQLTDAELSESSFDVVHLNNVFEHFTDPHKALEKIKYALKDKGELILVVPNSNSLAYRLFKKDWFALEVPRHIFTYNKMNMTDLLSQHGFTVTETVYQHTLGSLTSSLAYKKGKHVDAYSYMERLFWLMEFMLDPLFNVFNIGDWMVVRARLIKGHG